VQSSLLTRHTLILFDCAADLCKETGAEINFLTTNLAERREFLIGSCGFVSKEKIAGLIYTLIVHYVCDSRLRAPLQTPICKIIAARTDWLDICLSTLHTTLFLQL